ncbi:MAG: hypothetical protein CFH26_00693 [Alphaproteobacteria bacterium MarineAlpha6_Bin4]|nr:MAG: hypothetical protein CFH26_00693 [Alphaproteobacteria bacterium MarineAlpha6_Bin4]|tara:strand:+ start:23560 stop:24021 length:462 start_codon:yes stop_codon:yes gene_type:complete
MLKKQLTESLIAAVKNKDKESINTIRLIIAAIKDKEIAIKTDHKDKKISNEIIFNILKSMIKQRNESIALYKQGNRLELAENEKKEIDIIKGFLPKQLDDKIVKGICEKIVKNLNANSMSDMGKVMAELKKHESSSQIDIAKASSYVKIILNG